MAYTVTITDVGSTVTVNESSYAVDVTTNTYPVTVSYNALQLDGINVSDADITVAGNLVLTLSDASTIDAGNVKGDTGLTGSDGTPGTDGGDGVSVTDASTSGGNLVLTLSDTSTIDAGVLPSSDFDSSTIEANITTLQGNVATITSDVGNNTTSIGTIESTAGALQTEVTTLTGNVTTIESNYATTTYVGTAVSNLVASAPATLDTLNELAAALGDDANYATTTATSLGEKMVKTLDLGDVSNAGNARTNLGLGTASTTASTDYATAAQGALADSALQSFTETNDLSTAVTWANVPNANITESSVTQHQAALSITESQISDLAHYADADVDTHLNTSTATTSQLLSWTGTDYDWVAPGAGGLNNIVEDTTPQLGGDLDINTNNITGTGEIDITGTVTATEFIGTMNGEMVINAKAIGTAITKGDAIYISGISGNTPEVQLARSNSSTTMPAFGIAQADIALNATGHIVTFGQLTGTDVADWGEGSLTFALGDVLYVSASEAGKLTNVKPAGEANLIQNIGKIERIDPTTNATILVSGAGRTNATPALNTGNIFIGVANQSATVSLDGAVGTAGYIKDYTVTESDVTTHQAALSITESQISDLTHTTGLAWSAITSTPTTLSGYGITDALASTLAGNIDMNGHFLVDSSQTGTPTFELSKSYTDPATSTTSYVAQINGGDLHIDQDKATPNLVLMTNPNTGTTATTEFRMAGDPVTSSSTYNFGFMSMAGSGYAHPYLANIDPGELFFSNFNGDVVIGTGTGLATNGTHRCKFKVKSALGSSVFFGATGLPDFDALVVDENGDTTLGATLKLTDYEEKINTGLGTTGTLTPDPKDGTVQKITLTGDITVNALSNVSAGQTVTLIITQPASGNWTLTSTMKFAGGSKTLSTASDAIDIMSIFYDGAVYYASLSKGFA